MMLSEEPVDYKLFATSHRTGDAFAKTESAVMIAP
jgi:hypothetical protein